MTVQVIVLNGGSSSGKSTIARCLQQVLPQPWLATSIDVFVDALPPALQESGAGIEVGADGGVSVGDTFRELERAWMQGIAATVRAGAPTVVDDVFLGGAESQQRWRDALSDLAVLWVGVHCDPSVAAAREHGRGNRVPGMAASQAELVHVGVHYDLMVDTTDALPAACADEIAAHLR